MNRPSVEEIDKLAEKYLALKAEAEETDEKISQVKTQLVPLVEKFGAAHAKKSKRLAGNVYELVISHGHATEIVDAAVLRLQEKLNQAGASWLFRKLFRKVWRFEIAPTAEELLHAPALPEKAPENLRDLYCEEVLVKPKAPTLKVEPIAKAKTA